MINIDFTSPYIIADLCVAAVLLGVIVFFCFYFKLNKISILVLFVLLSLYLVFSIFELEYSKSVVYIITISCMFIICLSHIGKIRTALNKIVTHDNLQKKARPDKIIDRDALYNEVYEAVAACSRQKIGALITFEKHDNLSNLTKNGTIVNAPVTHELLMTIFYPGTRLHDGAVIIKENKIYAASVYYSPTTKALTGKYGSRHRAAIGISQISDSVTVVVSEETGRVSIAQAGEIEPVSLDDFIATLSEKIAEGE